MAATLAPSAIARLQEVYRAYDHATFPDLNRTADELQKTCRELGWVHVNDGPYLPWAREQLGLDIRGRPKA